MKKEIKRKIVFVIKKTFADCLVYYQREQLTFDREKIKWLTTLARQKTPHEL